jgi:GNAT superfamily N-acetyltransferase
MTDQPDIRFESKPLRRVTAAERRRLRTLTAGGTDSHLLTILRERPPYVRCFLAWHDDVIIGWSLARWFAAFKDSPRNAHISVFVDPEWRRQGFGRRLIGQAVDFAVAHRLTAWVYAGNADQLAFARGCEHPTSIVTTPFPLR